VSEGGRVVLLRDAALLDVAIEVGQGDGAIIGHVDNPVSVPRVSFRPARRCY
jgi:hypothetical protein